MDVAVPFARAPVSGTFRVPASKSLLQRALALAALAEGETRIEAEACQPPGDDVRAFARALEQLGRWRGSALGTSRDRLTLDLGLGATGFRLATALATLRLPGARTLIRGRPALVARPHRSLRRALSALGAHVLRKPSGAHRVIAGGLRGGAVSLGCRTSSQHVSALLLLAPRLGGLDVTLADRPVSRPYIELTLRLLAHFGIVATSTGLGGPGGRIHVEGGAPRAAQVLIEADASAAAVWWTIAALTGGEVTVPGVTPDSAQADVALLSVLARMGAACERSVEGWACVRGSRGGLAAPGDVDLADAPDLLPLVAVLAARAEGATRIHGVAHARGKESDRVAHSARVLRALGADVEERADGLVVRGGVLHGAEVSAGGDHRMVFALCALGLVVPGIRVQGAQAASKSQPEFVAQLVAAVR